VEDIIDIEWADRKLQRASLKERDGRRRLGADRWPAFKRRLRALEVAESLSDVMQAPGKFHPYRADKAGEWGTSLSPNWRLVFEPADDPLPRLPDGGVDVANIRRVRILRVEDYHGR